MDPTLKDYLDRMSQEARSFKEAVLSRSDEMISKQDKLEQQLTVQSTQLTDLCTWKPDLEARFTKLQEAVADLQRAQFPPPAAASGSATAHLVASPQNPCEGEIHGQVGHREHANSGGFSPVNSTLPAVPPVTGMLSL